MSENPKHKSHAVAWAICLLLVPVLYLLTLPLVTIATWHVVGLDDPLWLEIYSKPAEWISDTPLRDPYADYVRWWARVAGVGVK